MSRPNAVALCFYGIVAIETLILGGAISQQSQWALTQHVFNLSILKLQPAQVVPLPPPIATPPAAQLEGENGIASWYGKAWQGRRTASGKKFDARKLTAAHRTLPLNTRVRVTNLLNGQSVEVTINDRGPYVEGRMIDLSAEAARRLGMQKDGLAPVHVESFS
jgi:rare lipoprotein A (peptidoglycan hydrolase)